VSLRGESKKEQGKKEREREMRKDGLKILESDLKKNQSQKLNKKQQRARAFLDD